MKFWLGTHVPSWLTRTEAPLFVSRRRLTGRRTLPEARGSWALDSGGFTELTMFGGWQTNEAEYVTDVRRFEAEIGSLAWCAPMDWMCEPHVLAKTGLTVVDHMVYTVENFVRLRSELGLLVIPVLQGWERDDYLRCWDLYEDARVWLEDEPLVGVGTVCRRQRSSETAGIFRALQPLQLHGFGVKADGLALYSDVLASADSLAWSYRARRDAPLPGCSHRNCANCLRFALRWRERIVNDVLGQQRLELSCAV